MSCTTSPWIMRGRENTTRDARKSDEVAISSRLRTYLRICLEQRPGFARTRRALGGLGGHFGAPHLSIQPQRRGAVAVVEAGVRGVVLHRRLPRSREHRGVQIHVVLLLRGVPLNVEDELPARLQILRAHRSEE